MDRVKKILRRFFVVLCASMAVASVAKAATTSTDVQITIEAPESVISEISDTDNTNKNAQSVQTGDWASTGIYIVGVVAAFIVAAICLWKRKKNKVFMFLIAMALSVACMGFTSKAAEDTENVSVTIPTSVSVVFEQNGTTSISEFEVNNHSLVPITIEKIKVTECNDWELATSSETIQTNAKKLAFLLEEQCLQSGENVVDIAIPEGNGKKLNISVKRGAWTETVASETALNLEFEYTVGVKEFQITFDADGGSINAASIKAYNGETVTLPEAEKEMYAFKGWQDEDGNIYTSEYVMPIGDVKLTAIWKETEAYAVYSEDDGSFIFYRSDTPIQEGDIYNGKTVTNVYTGLEDSTYTEYTVPWYSIRTEIKQVEFCDKVSPVNTDFWFYHFDNASVLDGTNLDMSRVTSMRYMLCYFGRYPTDVTCVGIEDWDMSNVRDMFFSFHYFASRSQNVYIGDLSKWDVSSVTNMCRCFGDLAQTATNIYIKGLENWDVSNVTNMSMMFYDMGKKATTWSFDLRGWDVSKVTIHEDFNVNAETKVIEPNWVQ